MMTEKHWETAAFVFDTERDEWALVKHAFDNIHAVRSCGELHKFKSVEDAKGFVKQRSARALVQFYHEQMAKPEITTAQS